MAYAVARFWTSQDFEGMDSYREPSDPQKQYMREVRVRNQDHMWEDAAAGRPAGKTKRSEVPTVQESLG